MSGILAADFYSNDSVANPQLAWNCGSPPVVWSVSLHLVHLRSSKNQHLVAVKLLPGATDPLQRPHIVVITWCLSSFRRKYPAEGIVDHTDSILSILL